METKGHREAMKCYEHGLGTLEFARKNLDDLDAAKTPADKDYWSSSFLTYIDLTLDWARHAKNDIRLGRGDSPVLKEEEYAGLGRAT